MFIAEPSTDLVSQVCASCIHLVDKVRTFVTGQWSVLQVFLPSGSYHSWALYNIFRNGLIHKSLNNIWASLGMVRFSCGSKVYEIN